MNDQGTERLRALLAEAIARADPTLGERLERDPDAYLTLVRLGARASEYSDELLRRAVGSARGAGLSWEAIGRELGVSRQAVQQRFTLPPPPPASLPGGPGVEDGWCKLGVGGIGVPGAEVARRRLVLSPLTAFNEMAVLARAGRHGWHSVEYGPLYHLVQQSPRQWEHRRVTALGRGRLALEVAGWQMIGTGWFPWAYFKRELDLAALPTPEGWSPMARD